MKVPRWARITLISFVGVAALLVVGIMVLASLTFGPGPEARCVGHERFQLQAWRDTTQIYGPLRIRGCMVDDLLATHDFHGRTRAEVVGFLGEPPETEYFREYDLVYWLGPERGMMSIDSEWLVFRFDSAQRVREYRLVTD